MGRARRQRVLVGLCDCSHCPFPSCKGGYISLHWPVASELSGGEFHPTGSDLPNVSRSDACDSHAKR